MAPINSVIHTDRHSIDRVLGAGVPVLLIFARNDEPLPSELGLALDKTAATYAGKLLVARVNAGAEPDIVRRFGVGRTPALVAFSKGTADEAVNAAVPADVKAWARYLTGNESRPAKRQAASVADPTPFTRGDPRTLTDATFDAAVSGAQPVLVDFWAPWCGPCRMVAPSVERLGREFAGRAIVAKLNVDENPITSEKYRVRSIPNLLIFRNGKVVDQIVGAQPYEVLQQRLARQVG